MKRKEFLLAGMDNKYSNDVYRSHLFDQRALDAAEHVNDLIIDSIKAKLALIESSK